MSNLSDFVGGSKVFMPESTVYTTVGTGTTGTLFNITIPAGKWMKVKKLSSNTATAVNGNCTININGVDVFTGANIGDTSPLSTQFIVHGPDFSSTATIVVTDTKLWFDFLWAKGNFTVTSTTATGATCTLTYEIGEFVSV